MNKKYNIVFLAITMLILSCSENRTYLTEVEKEWNPYKKAQEIVFESSSGLLDSIFIEDINYDFPDGIGVIDKYEILTVIGINKTDIYQEKSNFVFMIHAKTLKRGSRIKFNISIKGSQFHSDYYSIDNLMKLPEEKVSVIYGSFDDVIKIKSAGKDSNMRNNIEYIYWSKSKGYVRFDEYDGTIWQLKAID